MSDFKTATLEHRVLDPYKRVHYTTGLVLGVDEFQQEQAFFMERDKLHSRALHGYGTVEGLNVSLRNEDSDPEIVVSAGMAVDPHGRSICVSSAQCANIRDWLNRSRGSIEAASGGIPDELTVYIELCYRACESDFVPVPGGPCRSQTDTKVASRIADHFHLKLTLEPPPQVEEIGVRTLGTLLRRVKISAESEPVTLEEWSDLMLGLIPSEDVSEEEAAASDDDADDDADDEIADSAAAIILHPESAAAYLQYAFRLWVTRVRPHFIGRNGCGTAADGDDCVLLGAIQIPVNDSDGVLSVSLEEGASVVIDGSARPYLLSTRVLQEWLVNWLHEWDVPRHFFTFATLFQPDERVFRAWVHHPDPLEIPAEALALEIDGTPFEGSFTVNTPLPGQNVFDIEIDEESELAVDRGSNLRVRFNAEEINTAGEESRPLADFLSDLDHQYVDREDSILNAYLILEGLTDEPLRLDDLDDVEAEAPEDGNVLLFRGGIWVPGESADLGAATGDVRGTYPDLRVVGLQGNAVSDADPREGQVLVWNAEERLWDPQSLQEGEAGGTNAEQDLTRITALSWVHDRNSPLQVNMDGNERLALVVGFGKAVREGGRGLVQPDTVNENTFRVFIEHQDGQSYFHRGILPDDRQILPVEITEVDEGGAITAVRTGLDRRNPAPAMAFLLSSDVFVPRLSFKVLIQIRGDFVLDEDGRAIDAEHTRATLPSGDRPQGGEWGTQGGTFESWVTFTGEGRVDINTASREELLALPGIGPATADRILELRREIGEIRSTEDLLRIPGLSRTVLEDIRPLIILRNS